MKDAATKKDVEDAIEDLAKMTKGSFDYMQEHTATKEDLKELRQELGEDMEKLERNMDEKLSHLEDRLDAKLDVFIDRVEETLNPLVESHQKLEQRVTIIERP